MSTRNKYYGFVTPLFIVDPNYITQGYGVEINWSRVPDSYRTTAFTVTVNAIAAQGATSVTVLALPKALKTGRILRFSATKYATLTADAAAGATTITTEALPVALAVNDAYVVPGVGIKRLKAGTILSKANGVKSYIPRSAKGGSDGTASCILLTDAEEGPLVENGTDASGYTGYGKVIGGPVYENLLPDYANASFSTFKTELATSGCTFYYETYSDSRNV